MGFIEPTRDPLLLAECMREHVRLSSRHPLPPRRQQIQHQTSRKSKESKEQERIQRLSLSTPRHEPVVWLEVCEGIAFTVELGGPARDDRVVRAVWVRRGLAFAVVVLFVVVARSFVPAIWTICA